MLAKLPGEIRVVGDDVAEKYLLLSNAHDGTSAVRVGFTPIRVVCQNTLNIALRGMGGVSICHYADVADRVKQAHSLLGIVGQTFDRAEAIMRFMAHTPIVGDGLRDYFTRVLPVPTQGEEDLRRTHHSTGDHVTHRMTEQARGAKD
jgi:hypothetical protein